MCPCVGTWPAANCRLDRPEMAQHEKCTKTDAWHHTRLILHQIQIHLYSPHRSLIVTSNVILNPKSLLRNPPKNPSLVAEFLKHLSRPMISFQSPELSQEGWYCLWMDNISDRLILSTISIYILNKIYMYIIFTYIPVHIIYILTEYNHRPFVFMRC